MAKQPHYDLLYICDWVPPDFGSVGQFAEQFTRHMAERGQTVALLGLTSGASGDRTDRIGAGSLRIVKLPAKPFNRANRLGRLWWTVKINTRLLGQAWPLMRQARKVLFTGSPPLFLHWIAPANLLLRKELIYRIADFHPECAIAERGKPSLLLKLIYAMTLFWRRRVTSFEVLGLDQAVRLEQIGIPPSRIHYVPNPPPVDITPDMQPLPRPSGSEGKVLLLYSGNWGIAHDRETFVAAYRHHHRHGRASVLLWLNAIGTGAVEVEAALKADGLPFVRGKPLPLDQLASLLITPDAHLITLLDSFVGYVLPSKVHGCIESGRPVLFIGSERSDVHRLCVERSVSGYQRVSVGDVEGCARALDLLGATARVASESLSRAVSLNGASVIPPFR